MSQYLLQSYVHIYANAERAILLDLRHDAYIGLDRRQVSALQPLVRGWPSEGGAGSTGRADPDALALANRLMERGLLTTNEDEGKGAAQPILAAIEGPLIEKYSDERSSLGWGHVAHFLGACASARWSLSCGSLERLVRRIKERKAARARSLEESQLRELTIAFHYLRPFLYTARQRCLFDSVALINFLAAYDVFPTWVIGVQPTPFAAHAWVQHGQFILSGDPLFARRYVPILVI